MASCFGLLDSLAHSFCIVDQTHSTHVSRQYYISSGEKATRGSATSQRLDGSQWIEAAHDVKMR